ncbi:MAG: hypothetical protein NTY38_07670 [Acidobacteria bacterium]|nr:hypothetical protein [Acidobacteriota bacterium]
MMGILELVRRIGLLGGICACCWYALETPRVLLEVKRADFGKEYERKFGKRDYPMMGAMEMGREFLRKHANPGSAEAYGRQVTEKRSLPPGGAEWSNFYRALPAEGAFYAMDRPPMAAIARDIDLLFAHTRSLVLYLPVKEGHLEIWYWNQPKQSKAPASLLYPARAMALLWLAAGLAVYAILPWPKQRPDASTYGRIPVLGMDFVGALFAGFFFALPLWTADSTMEAMNEEFGTTVFCWSVAGVCALFLLAAARTAAYRVAVEPFGLRLETLWRSRLVPFAEMTGAGYTVRREIKTGIFIQTRTGGQIRMDWASLLRFEVVLGAIGRAGVPSAADVSA